MNPDLKPDFDAGTYWEDRLRSRLDLSGVGYQGLGRSYNGWMYRVRARVFRRLLAGSGVAVRNAAVADIGCGTGFYVDLWSQAGAARVDGLDITDTAVAALSVRRPGGRFVRADIGAELPPDWAGCYDIVSAFDVLFHIVDDERWVRALHNLAALLKPGGTLFISDNYLRGPAIRERHHVSRRLDDYRTALAGAGLAVTERRPMFVIMNQPVDSPPIAVRAVWAVVSRLVWRAEPLGWLVGASLYPFELALTALSIEGPTTEIMTCRKLG